MKTEKDNLEFIKVIFLDFDGVIVLPSSRWLCADMECVKWLHIIVQETGAKIVVSSTWRKHGMDRIEEALSRPDIFSQIIGITDPHISNRGEGISKWLAEHPEVSDFCVIDDEAFDIPPHLDKLVKTETAIGIEEKHVGLAIELLGGKKND